MKSSNETRAFKAPFLALRAVMFAFIDEGRPALQFLRFEQLSSIGAGDLKRIAAIATNGHVMVVVRWPGELEEPDHVHRDDIERALKLGTFGDRRKTMFEIGPEQIGLGSLESPRYVDWKSTDGTRHGYPEWRRVMPNISHERWEVEQIGVDPRYLQLPAEHLKGIQTVTPMLKIAMPPDKWGALRLDCNVEDDAETFLDITYIIMPTRLD